MVMEKTSNEHLRIDDRLNEDQKAKRVKKVRLLAYLALFIIFILLAAAIALFFYLNKNFESTDNAYVQGNLVSVSSMTEGCATEIYFDQGQFVNEGDILLKLDQSNAIIQVEMAKISLNDALRNVIAIYLKQEDALNQISLREAELSQVQIQAEHRQALSNTNAIAKEQILASNTQLKLAEVNIEIAKSLYQQSLSQIAGSTPLENNLILQAKANLEKALLNLENTTIKSPVTGVVAQRMVQVGQLAGPGQVLFTVVPFNQFWIEANFKETQLENISFGQKVEMFADLYGDEVIFNGSVMGIKPGTGLSFSLIPAQNATGNWVKVVQRVPVIIGINPNDLKDNPLIPGLSMHVKVSIVENEKFNPLYNEPVYELKTSLYNDRLDNIKKEVDDYLKEIATPFLPLISKFMIQKSN
jgi:membrane fusion protein (multidrug efflux system)